jgi:hypothetical protein
MTTGNDDPESTPLPAPLPGLGVAGPDPDLGAEAALHGQADADEPPPRAAPPAAAAARAPAAVPVAAETNAAAPKRAKEHPGERPSAHGTSKAADGKAGKAGNGKMWLVIAGLGVAAVGAIAAVVLLPGPNPQNAGPGGQERPVTKPGGPAVGPVQPVEPSEPVRVTPVAGDPSKPASPSEPTGAKSPPSTTAQVAQSKPDKADKADKPEETDESDEPETPGNTTGKPSRAERREHAKAARAAAKAAKAAKAAAAAEPEAPAAPVKALSQEILRQNMLRAESHFKGCAKEAWGSFVTISIVVDNSGTVQKADLIGPLGSTATGHCISDQIRKQHFPPFTEGASKQFVWSYQIPAAN